VPDVATARARPRAKETVGDADRSFIFCPEASGVLAPLHATAARAGGARATASPPVTVSPASSTALSIRGGDDAAAPAAPRVLRDDAEPGDDAAEMPYLLLLVPSAHVNAMHGARDGGAGDAGGYGVGQDDSWVEIGCHVANARLVTNVQFSVPTDA